MTKKDNMQNFRGEVTKVLPGLEEFRTLETDQQKLPNTGSYIYEAVHIIC